MLEWTAGLREADVDTESKPSASIMKLFADEFEYRLIVPRQGLIFLPDYRDWYGYDGFAVIEPGEQRPVDGFEVGSDHVDLYFGSADSDEWLREWAYGYDLETLSDTAFENIHGHTKHQIVNGETLSIVDRLGQ